VRAFEMATDIPAYDTVATVVWKALRMVGVDTEPLERWGRLFGEMPSNPPATRSGHRNILTK
jgi:maleate isomerase